VNDFGVVAILELFTRLFVEFVSCSGVVRVSQPILLWRGKN
jgi:hypothetical protein